MGSHVKGITRTGGRLETGVASLQKLGKGWNAGSGLPAHGDLDKSGRLSVITGATGFLLFYFSYDP